MNLGKAIKLLLEKKGITQKELAKLIKKSETSISLILQNRTSPRKDTLKSISEVLGVKPEILALLSVEKEDFAENKKIYYDMMWPDVESTIIKLFTEN